MQQQHLEQHKHSEQQEHCRHLQAMQEVEQQQLQQQQCTQQLQQQQQQQQLMREDVALYLFSLKVKWLAAVMAVLLSIGFAVSTCLYLQSHHLGNEAGVAAQLVDKVNSFLLHLALISLGILGAMRQNSVFTFLFCLSMSLCGVAEIISLYWMGSAFEARELVASIVTLGFACSSFVAGACLWTVQRSIRQPQVDGVPMGLLPVAVARIARAMIVLTAISMLNQYEAYFIMKFDSGMPLRVVVLFEGIPSWCFRFLILAFGVFGARKHNSTCTLLYCIGSLPDAFSGVNFLFHFSTNVRLHGSETNGVQVLVSQTLYVLVGFMGLIIGALLLDQQRKARSTMMQVPFQLFGVRWQDWTLGLIFCIYNLLSALLEINMLIVAWTYNLGFTNKCMLIAFILSSCLGVAVGAMVCCSQEQIVERAAVVQAPTSPFLAEQEVHAGV
eukprot:TRINITY_DN569_c1_g2_i1.p1 TRINITY_DN569_c1_g2~~TRINITY_DN569_c1_g2_i1.p1  ORF type:complete len:442 (+),score=93.89 TRINITY_DN569_c1_g2_i1:63-1388(+)